MAQFLLLEKYVTKSVLRDGFGIPVRFAELFYTAMGLRVEVGSPMPVHIVIDGAEYNATVQNSAFDRTRFPGHCEQLQIRYSPNSPIAMKLRQVFSATEAYISANARTDRKRIVIPDEQKEFLAVYSSDTPGTFVFDCLTVNENNEVRTFAASFDELSIETFMSAHDTSAGLIQRPGIEKVRRMNRLVCDLLKEAYDYRCQICGAKIGEPYGSKLIHAHHIDYFSKSLNNDAANVMIVCPNHHGIIHDRNPQFDRNRKLYIYPNGHTEGLKLNKHL